MKNVFIGMAIGLALAIAGSMDYEDAKDEEALYCNNVKSGVWPDYNGNYADVCEAEYGKAKKVKNISI